MEHNYPGILITLEGIDGSGKSSIARELHTFFSSQYQTVLTKEPGGTPLGQRLRDLLQYQDIPVVAKAQYLLFAADRAQHFAYVVVPSLEQKCLVISDRMADSSIVYQGHGHGL